MATSSQPPPRKRTQAAAAAASQEVNGAPAKRLRRPSVLLNQSYYETFSGRRRFQPSPLKLATKSRTPKPANVDNTKQGNNGSSNNGKGFQGFNSDDNNNDAAIGNWKNLNTGVMGNSNFKSKAKAKKFISTSGSNEDQNNERENGKQRETGQEMDFARKSELRRSHFGIDNKPIDDDDGDRNVADGVRAWLDRLGLGKYALLFKVHGVDDEVLPLLTIDDLKDMGISAIGSRRKIYHSIKKLGNGFA